MESSSEKDPMESVLSSSSFEKDRHVKFLQMMYQVLPYNYQTHEINRLTLAYFVISGLDLLASLHFIDKDAVAEWVLSFQAHPSDEAQLNNGQFYGFSGSRTSQFPPDDNGVLVHNGSHLASTYCALAILKIIGYNFSKIDSVTILTSMKNLQQPDGSFMPIHTGAERDLRFIYCAAAICSLLKNWSGMDKEKAKEYILSCQSYDGGFGLIPGSESHGPVVSNNIIQHGTGGATYCAVASLQLMGFIEDDIISKNWSSCIINVPLLLDWSLQVKGHLWKDFAKALNYFAFDERIGAVLRILGGHKFIEQKSLRGFLLTCQSEYGGFSKFPGMLPDLYHSYYGFTAFSLLEESGLNPLCVELGISDIATSEI
ncbi:hypothetical protein F8388_016531 [Cannabis sativa]|uniref:Prenyltransferase alpha-alpha toroid domain-containing protein n=1 Tax=Cannabis sativa TaxID=3483 RepID=A0A7J6EY77_CANSA|nr:hypothetical protein F8388_016531 [Cannabis sativa]